MRWWWVTLVLVLMVLHSACNFDKCGDGICQFGEEAICPEDCQALECTYDDDCDQDPPPGCQGVWHCENGECIFECYVCDDTDGDNYFNKGTVTFGPDTYTDYCESDVLLIEYVCEGTDEFDDEEERCDYGCLDGACIFQFDIDELEMSIQTMKHEYDLEEHIKLTDPPSPSPAEPSGPYDGYIIEFTVPPLTRTPGGGQRIAAHGLDLAIAELRLLGLEIQAEFRRVFSGVSVDIPEELLDDILASPYVKAIHPNYEVETVLMDSIPLIGADQAWTLQDPSGTDLLGTGVTIGIIDTGVDYTHSDLGGCYGTGCRVVGGYDFVNDDADPMDDHGHGTHCAATAAGHGALEGVAPDATIYAYKVLNSGGSGYMDDVVAAIERSVDPNQDGDFSDHLDVISLSLGSRWGNPDDPTSTAIDNAVEAGVLAVVAAGNNGPMQGSIGSPGTARKAFTVGATDKNDDIAHFSSRGPVEWDGGVLLKPDIVAPGVQICAARYPGFEPWLINPSYQLCLDDYHVLLDGTSMATPHVAGLAALMRQMHPDWTIDDIKRAITNTALDIGEPQTVQGYGRIKAYQAVTSPKPPIAHIATVGKIPDSNFDVLGTASGDGFQSYELTSQACDTCPTELLCTETTPVIDGVLCAAHLQEGEYTLRLEVVADTTSVAYSMIVVRTVEIEEPGDLRDRNQDPYVLPTWKDIEIIGSATHDYFHHYEMEWCYSDEYGTQNDCTSDGLTLTNGGLQEVRNGPLAEFDESVITVPSFYLFQLRVFDSEDQDIGYFSSLTYIDPQLQAGWPNMLDGAKPSLAALGDELVETDDRLVDVETGQVAATDAEAQMIALSFQRQPTIANIDGDEDNEMVMAYHKDVSVVRHDASFSPGWPQQINTTCGSREAIMQQGPAVADLDTDGLPELAVGDNCGYLHIFNHDGTYVPGWPARVGFSVVNTPTIIDLDNDGELELLYGDWTNRVWAQQADKDEVPGNWPVYLEPAPNATIAYIPNLLSAGDLDNDGTPEIVATAMACIKPGGCSPLVGERLDRLWVLDSFGNIILGPFEYPAGIMADPVLVDVDDDGFLDILVNTYTGELHAYDRNGVELPGWPHAAPGYGRGIYQIAAGDIDNDHSLDFAVGYERLDWTDSCGVVLDNQANPKPGWPKCRQADNYYFGSYSEASIGFAQLDQDPSQEVIMRARSGSYRIMPEFMLFDHEGGILDGFPKPTDNGIFGDTTPVGDLDGDGDNEFIASTWSGMVYVYDFDGRADRDSWPVYHHDARHSGCYGCSPDDIPFVKSMIMNTADVPAHGQLVIFLERAHSTGWGTMYVPVNQSATIPAGDYLALDLIWNPQDVIAEKPGQYRVRGVFLIDGNQLEASYEFEVVRPTRPPVPSPSEP